MTRIDRYIAWLFLRTVVICFVSLSGIVIVFHAFTSMDDLVRRGQAEGGLVPAMARYYGRYLLLIFDWTGTIIAVMSVLFTAGWLRRTGELTAALSTGVSHGRVFRPMLAVAVGVIGLQLACREVWLPQYRDTLSTRAKTKPDEPQPVLAQYDKVHRVLIDAESLTVEGSSLIRPAFRIDGDFAGFGDLLIADAANHLGPGEGFDDRFSPSSPGYLLRGVSRPRGVASLPSARHAGSPILLTARDTPGLRANECFVVSGVGFDAIQTNELTTKLASVRELVRRVSNPAVHCDVDTRIMLHARIVRAVLDMGLVCLVLPLAAASDRKVLVASGSALGIVIGFFALKMVATFLGGGQIGLPPAWAGWLPLLIVGPIGYARWRMVAEV